MKHPRLAIFVALALLALLTTAVALVVAQSSASFNLEWHVMGNGGGASSSAAYHVSGTLGQGVAGPPTVGSAGYAVSSGYWQTAAYVYLPAVVRR